MVRRDIEKDVVPYVQQHHKGIIAYSPMQRGLLTGKFEPGTKLSEGDNRKFSRYFKPDNIRKINEFLDQIKPIARNHDVTLAQLSLSWAIHQPGVVSALAGSRTPHQIDDNARAADLELTPEELQTISDHLDKLNLDLD
jgi:aryl-alcohol dehydrogenase-like predicted oxidoreductase